MRQDEYSDRAPAMPEAAQDLVFDFTGTARVDLGGLALLLTAREMAHRDDRRVWVRALPDRTWRLLHALGLEHCFQLFPNSGECLN